MSANPSRTKSSRTGTKVDMTALFVARDAFRFMTRPPLSPAERLLRQMHQSIKFLDRLDRKECTQKRHFNA